MGPFFNRIAVFSVAALFLGAWLVPALAESAEEAGNASPVDEAMAILEDEALQPAERRVRIQALLNENEEEADLWTAYGEALEDVDEAELAMMAFERAAELDPERHTPWFRMGLLAKRGTPSPDLEKAEEAFRNALETGAPRARTLNELAVTLALQNRMQQAVGYWEQAIEEDPEWGVLYNNLFRAAANLGDEALAERHVDAAIQAERFEENAILLYGEYLAGRGKFPEAASVYRRAVAEHPGAARLRYYFGVALEEAGELEEAEHQLRAAMAIASEADDETMDVMQAAHFGLFRIQHPQAEGRFQNARRLVFEEETNTNRARRNLERAIRELTPLVQEHPEFWNGFFVRGVANRRLNNREEAHRDFRRVLELVPNEPNATMELALMKRDEHEFEEAAELADRAVELAPRDPIFAINASLIMIEADRCERAWELYRAAMRMVPEEHTAFLREELEVRCP